MIGWATPITPEGYVKREGITGPVGLIVTKAFPEPAFVLDALERAPDHVFFVVRDRDTFTRNMVIDAGQEHRMILAPLCDWWKVGSYDGRRGWRDREMIHYCTTVLIFRRTGEKGTDLWLPDKHQWWIKTPKVRLIERGPRPRKKARKGRVPVGA